MVYKRLQVSLPIWMSDFFDVIVDAYSVKEPDLVRVILCIGLIRAVEARFPEFRSVFADRDRDYFFQNFEKGSREERARLFEEHNYEAQRAIKFLLDARSLPSEPFAEKKTFIIICTFHSFQHLSNSVYSNKSRFRLCFYYS